MAVLQALKDVFVIKHVLLESMDSGVFTIAVINVEVQINSATTLMVIASMGVSVVFKVTYVTKYVLIESLDKNVYKTVVATVEEQINCVTTLMVTAPMDVSVVSRVTSVIKVEKSYARSLMV
ncbi:hypothetical protein RRG08_024116 [Elysia crispata]|uniref:Uncharacterized protein n=1 Tax=Elysia crispata TaxID=231223 RepID=A0AAE0ZQD3_9GAST|nr:hypothetical protein RRG08_024116 [Elysia crispata]